MNIDPFTIPDGERFVDSWSEKGTIPSVETWADMQINQLFEVRSQLEDKIWTFRNNPSMSNPLNQSLMKVNALISQRLSQ